MWLHVKLTCDGPGAAMAAEPPQNAEDSGEQTAKGAAGLMGSGRTADQLRLLGQWRSAR